VEEGIVRDDIPGSRNLGSRDYWVGVRGLRGPLLEQLRKWAKTCTEAPEHGPSTEGAGTRVCWHVNKEERVDRGLRLPTYTCLYGVSSCGSEPQG
jgi:hypothetical protein